MKNNLFLNISMLLLFSMGVETASAQGLVVSKKNGTSIKVPYEQLDCVTVYDAENPNPGETTWPQKFSKKLVAIDEKQVAYYSETPSYYTLHDEYTYDENGRLVTASTTDYEDDEKPLTEILNYKWNEQTITMTKPTAFGHENVDYVIVDGKIVNYTNSIEEVKFTYDNENQLIEYSETDKWNDTDTWKNTWQNGVPTKTEERVSYDESSYQILELEYSEITCNGYLPFLVELFSAGDLIGSAHPDLLGKVIQKLPSKMTYTDEYHSEGTTTFSYKFDKDGYVVECVMNETLINKSPDAMSEKNTITTTHTYTWE